MAYEAVESLQQTLLIILERDDDDLITPSVEQQTISILYKAAALQFNLKHFHFPEKEIIREVADTTEEIILYLFSPQYLSDRGFIHPSFRLSNQLEELAEELDSTVGYVVDYVRQRSDSALESQVVDPTEMIAISTNRLRRLAGIIKSRCRELTDEDSPSIMTKDPVVVVGFDEDIRQMMDRITPYTSYPGLQILPVVGMAGIDAEL
ncbi:uncharacterized protein LOC125223547 [Salvia hispanica]|uniref:uncharacterized protein LOC125223547 n=1 Tax=Salvia hispanica TaxID=49212 RepID=UPI002009199B|nr:uncharacterized protein LOC125223547 [Salvia hispanica]